MKVKRRIARRLQKRRKWRVEETVRAGGDTVYGRPNLTVVRGSRGRAAKGYWTQGEAICGSPFSVPLGYTITAPPVHSITGGADWAWIRYYVYRYGYGWEQDSGWEGPYPVEAVGALAFYQGQNYTQTPHVNAWVGGAVAIALSNANWRDWNWVPTNTARFYGYEVDSSHTWCHFE